MITKKQKILLNIILLLATILTNHIIKLQGSTLSSNFIFIYGSIGIWGTNPLPKYKYFLLYSSSFICLIMLVIAAIYNI